MPHGDEAIQALRAALAVSPDNLPLRLHLIRSLAGYGRFDEAERECREALARAPANAEIKLELAAQFAQQGKNSQALVIVEDLVRQPDPPAKAYVLYARLLLRADDVPNAVAQYKNALEIDPAAADAELGERLGVRPPGDEAAAYEDEVVEGRVRASYDDDAAGRPTAEIERPKVSFRDVGGMESLKEEISLKIIYPLQHADLYKAYGKAIGGGILMYGPPGCGKTHLARATAGEIKANFLTIGISDVLDMWIGRSERNLHELFEQARANKPCVLFFDEVDALGGRRADMHSGSARQLINQFLAEMDGIERSNDGVLILAATNAPWHVDPAFRRPGRFDRVLFVPPPDQPARREILQIHCKGKPLESIDFEQLAAKTDAFSGADLKAVVDQAVESKLREAMKSGALKPLSTKDLVAAAKSLKPTTREWFSTARNYALYSNQGGVYDDVLKYLKMQWGAVEHDSFHLVQRAWAAYQAEHYDLAEQEARGALALEPNDAEALSVLSLCAMQRNDRPNAVQLAEKALSHAADEAIYHYRLAVIHARFGDDKNAEPPLRNTLELNPEFAPAYSLYAWVYFARGHYDIALSGIDEALKFDPFDLDALNLKVDLLRKKGDTQGALRAAEEALRVHPENQHAHAMVGLLQLERRNRASAIGHLKESLRIDPDTAWVRQTYANALEGRAFPARVLMRVSRAALAVLVECSFVVPLFWLGYLRGRQGYGVATDWHPIPLGLVVGFHAIVILAWWGPLLSFLTIPRSSGVRQIIGAEHGFLERTRVTYLWQLLVSAAILISSASIFIAGGWIAPLACAVGGVAIAMLVCALANTPAAWIASRVCAAAVCVLSVAWFLDPAALQSNRSATRKPLAKCFPIAVIASVAIIPTLNEPRGKWLTRS